MNNLDLKKFNFHLLIIDDDQKIRLLLKKFLENNDLEFLMLKTQMKQKKSWKA